MSAHRSAGSKRPERAILGPSAARAAAIALLARRDYARAELAARLLARGFAASEVTAAIEELAAAGSIDDARYALHYVTYHSGRGQGPIRIGAELRRHGLPAALIEAALAGGPDWCALARRVRRAKFGTREPASWPEKARQARFLQYRGFSSDHIRAATGADPEAGPTDP
jgi:regulatory protein